MSANRTQAAETPKAQKPASIQRTTRQAPQYRASPNVVARAEALTDIDGREQYEVELYALRPLVAEREAGGR
jgi:hypothetical protein